MSADLHLAVGLPGARAVFTTRRGGHSTGPFTSLNLGALTDDDPEAVRRNRQALAGELQVTLAFVHQVHGSRVVSVTGRAGARSRPPYEEADGVATATSGVAPAVLTADCLPIAIAGGGAVAMVHAGWRGLASGVIGEGVRAVRALAGSQEPVSAAIGPGAGVCCYEVGDEVRDAFSAHRDAIRHGRHVDLKAIARAELRTAGVERVEDVELCTICSDARLFFSHRRDGGTTGRQAGIVWLT